MGGKIDSRAIALECPRIIPPISNANRRNYSRADFVADKFLSARVNFCGELAIEIDFLLAQRVEGERGYVPDPEPEAVGRLSPTYYALLP